MTTIVLKIGRELNRRVNSSFATCFYAETSSLFYRDVEEKENIKVKMEMKEKERAQAHSFISVPGQLLPGNNSTSELF